MRRRLSSGILIALLLCAVGTGVADARATGNAQAIAVVRSVHRAFEKARAESFVTTGSFVINDQLSPSGAGNLQWAWNRGYVPRGWVPATEHVEAALRHDRLVWMVDDVVPHCGHHPCRDVPAQFVLDQAGLFAALGRPPRTCYRQVTLFPWHVGEPWFVVSGHYLGAPAFGDGLVRVTSRSPWGKTQTITETLTISAKTKLTTLLVAHISRGGRGHPPFTIRSVITHPSRPPALPTVHPC